MGRSGEMMGCTAGLVSRSLLAGRPLNTISVLGERSQSSDVSIAALRRTVAERPWSWRT